MTELKFDLDRSGFPMLWVDVIDAYIHWMPVTKVQFEYFLCAAPNSDFDSEWYNTVLALNPRISPNEIRLDNYWRALLTGILPIEVQRFARWSGENYSVPTLQEWFETYNYLKEIPAEPNGIFREIGELRDRTRTVLERLDSASKRAIIDAGYERTLAEQMLMRMGVLEWVECREKRFQWGGMGETHPSFHGGLVTPDHGQPSIPNNPDSDRLYSYGFRLIKRR